MPKLRPERRHPAPVPIDTALEGDEIVQRIDEVDPVETDDEVDLRWVRDTERAGTVEAAAHGDVTPGEMIDDVAAGLGFERPDDEDDYDR
jgi:hypothetical protein